MAVGIKEPLRPAMKKAVTDKEFITVVLVYKSVWDKLVLGDEEGLKKGVFDRDFIKWLLSRYEGLSMEVLVALMLETLFNDDVKTIEGFQHNELSFLMPNKMVAIAVELSKHLVKKPVEFKKPVAEA